MFHNIVGLELFSRIALYKCLGENRQSWQAIKNNTHLIDIFCARCGKHAINHFGVFITRRIAIILYGVFYCSVRK